MRPPRLLVTAGAVALFALAACGGGGAAPTGVVTPTAGTTATYGASAGAPAATGAPNATTSAGGGTIDTCSLLSAAVLKTATGADYGEGVADGYGQCVYRVGGATNNNGNGQVTVAIADSPLSTLKGMFGTGGVDLIVGGKTAFWNPAAGVQTLWVDLGTRALALSFDPVTEATGTIAEKLAEVAVSGLR